MSTIAGLQSRIAELQAANIKIAEDKKVVDGEVIPALNGDLAILQGIKGAQEANAFLGQTDADYDKGTGHMANGAFYFGGSGNSAKIAEIKDETGSLKDSNQNAISVQAELIGEAQDKLKTASNASQEYQGKIDANNNEISRLETEIEKLKEEEERRRNESESGDDAAAEAYEYARQNKLGVFAMEK